MLVGCGPVVTGISAFKLPTDDAKPGAIACCDSRGDAWFTEISANKIGRLANDGEIVEYVIPTPNSGPADITIVLERSGTAAYFSETNANKIGRISSSGVVTEYTIPTLRSGPAGIVGDSDFDGVWFTEFQTNKIGHLGADGHFSEYALPFPRRGPWRITEGVATNIPFKNAGGSSDAYWFTEALADRIGRITRAGSIKEYKLQSHASPFGIGSQYSYAGTGSVWFTEFKRNRIGILSPTGSLSEIELDKGNSPTELTVGEEGTVWFIQAVPGGNQIGVTTFGESTWMPASRVFWIPTAIPAHIGGIASLGDNLWYTDWGNNRIMKVSVFIPASNF